MLTRAARATLIGLFATAATAGCSLGLMPAVILEGQLFPLERAKQLSAGMREEEAEALLGTPLHRLAQGDRVVLSYQFERQLRECRPYFGPIPLRPARTESHALQLTFVRGGLERARYRERSRDRRTETLLVGGSKDGS